MSNASNDSCLSHLNSLQDVFVYLKECNGIIGAINEHSTSSHASSSLTEEMDDEKYFGYIYCHQQDVECWERTKSIYIGFGAPDIMDDATIGEVLCDTLLVAGFDVEWNGSANRRVKVINLKNLYSNNGKGNS